MVQLHSLDHQDISQSLCQALGIIHEILPDASLIPTRDKGKSPAHIGSQKYHTTPIELKKGLESGKLIRKCGEDGKLKNIAPYITGFKIQTGKPYTYQEQEIDLVALDIDGPKGEQKLNEILRQESLPKTVAWTSGKKSRSTHLYKIPAGRNDLVFKDVRLNDELELKAGSWPGVTVPPSAHPETGQYRHLDGCAFDQVPIADLPERLLTYLIPSKPKPEPTWEAIKQSSPPFPCIVPLIECCREDIRDLISVGVPEGSGHNDAALEVLAELVSVESYLKKIRQGYSQTTEGLYQDFVAASGIEYGQTEQGRLDSTLKKSGKFSCIEDAVDNCIRGWYWRENKPYTSHKTKAVEKTEKADDDKQLEQNIQDYLKETNQIKKIRSKNKLKKKYDLSEPDFKQICQILERKSLRPKQTVFSFHEFMNQGSEAIEWIIPNYLPRGETLLLVAKAKVGKTLLATAIAYGFISGNDTLGEKIPKKGRVLLITSDESPNSTRRRLKAAGFDLLPDADNLKILTQLDLNDLSTLETELEDFRPDLTIIDSLTSITQESGFSEKDAEFARPIYKLKDLLGQYGSAGILIHHESKSSENKGIDKVSGSARITAAVWGIWQLTAANTNDDKDPRRWLKIKPREGEATTHILEINPKDEWASKGIFDYIGEFGDEDGSKKTQAQTVLDLLTTYKGRGLTFKEINDLLHIGRGLYQVLDRLEGRIEKRRSKTNPKQWVYAVPCTEYQQEESEQESQKPTHSPEDLLNNVCNPYTVRNTDNSTVIQQPFNKHSTRFNKIQQTFNIVQQSFQHGSDEDAQSLSTEGVSSSPAGIQQIHSTNGECVGSENVESAETGSTSDVLHFGHHFKPGDLANHRRDDGRTIRCQIKAVKGQDFYSVTYPDFPGSSELADLSELEAV